MGSGESANPRQGVRRRSPRRDLNPSEAKVLSMAIKPELGTKFCSTWDITDFNGEPITIGFVSRVLQESQDDGSERLICER